ncbi:MAG: polysaccharide deacetylase family protein, partial [Chrysiogenetes bacterium]|nr:polysaccharide deacetylase family protein [Chrysiogenetes bacterium]
KGDLTRVLREREETLRKELDASRAERERGASVLNATQEEYEKILREHGVLSEKAQRLDEDVAHLTAAAKRESERARSMAAEVVGLEDRIRELTQQLERAQTPRDASEEEQERIAAAIAVEREKATSELKRLREQGEDLAHRMRKAEREAENLSAARAEIERRAEAAESLVRERLKAPAPAAESAAAPAALGSLSESLGRSASDLVSSLDRLDQFMKRLPELASTTDDEAEAASDVLAQKVQAMEIVGRRLEAHLARLEANPSDAAMLPPPGAVDPALHELKSLSEMQAREMAALREQLAALAKASANAAKDSSKEKSKGAAPPPPAAQAQSSATGIYAAAAVIVLLLGAVVAGGFVAYSRLASRIDEGQALARKYLEQASTPRSETAAAMAPLPLPRLTNPPAGSTVRGERLDLKGEAGSADAVFLYVGNALYTVTGVRGGKFTFEDVPLEAGKNLVALRAVTDSGRTSDRWETTLLRTASIGAEPPRRAVRDFMRGPTDRKEIALTFDGDDPKGALAVLDILKRNNIRTTIFLTGQFIDLS